MWEFAEIRIPIVGLLFLDSHNNDLRFIETAIQVSSPELCRPWRLFSRNALTFGIEADVMARHG